MAKMSSCISPLLPPPDIARSTKAPACPLKCRRDRRVCKPKTSISHNRLPPETSSNHRIVTPHCGKPRHIQVCPAEPAAALRCPIGIGMRTLSYLGASLALAVCGFGQADQYAAGRENIVFKTVPGKQLFPEDVRCGEYFWKSDKADKTGATVLYFFYGDPAYGKNKLGLYKQKTYTVAI